MAGNIFPVPVEEVIKKRTSVRTYKPAYVSEETELKLKEFADQVVGPFTVDVRFAFINDNSFKEKTGGKIGTYGIIKGAKNFIAVLVNKKEEMNLEEVGYTFEKLILYATYLGLGTCWLGGTFKKKDIDKFTGSSEDEIIPVISPVGYSEERKSITDKFMKKASNSKKRKSWKTIFFNKTFNSPVNEEDAGEYALPLEMVRLAPSAANIQPWRLVKDNNYWHFFMEYSKIINTPLGFEIQRIDMGIAMCHFELAANEKEIYGEWEILESIKKENFEGLSNLKYIVSWKEIDNN